MKPREYVGYIDNGDNTFDFYYETINYDFLDIPVEEIPEGMTEWEYIDTLMNPEDYTLTYKGVVYENGPEGFYTISESDGSGRKYTLEIHDDGLRIVSYCNYTAEDLPEQFETKPQYPAGDVNCDNVIDPFDYLLVKDIYFNPDKYTEDELALADCNDDGEVDMFDYLFVKSAYFNS